MTFNGGVLRGFHRRRVVLFLAGTLLAGCGGSTNAPGGRVPTAPRPASLPGLSSNILVTAVAGADHGQLWEDFNLIPLDVLPDGVTYRTQLQSGNLADIIVQIQSDPRVAAAEINIPVDAPLLRQSSVAFNEGFMTPGEFFDQDLAGRLGLAQAHETSRGSGVKVAIIDTGVNPDHPVLAGRILAGSRDFLGQDFSPIDEPNGMDDDADGVIDEATGHGTHVAGLVALVAPSARIMALRVLDSDGRGYAYDVAGAIEYAVDRGVRIINLSIGLTSPSAIVQQAIGYAVEHDAILITAAGNSPGGPVDFPASDPRVWAIAAVDKANRPTTFTSAFPGVVISAPGEAILSTNWDGGFAIWSGTSMAAPLVAGSAALVRSRHPGFSAVKVLQTLQTGSSPFAGNPVNMGAGVVNPGLAVGAPSPGPLPLFDLPAPITGSR